jgi:hypothetical protein
MKRSVELDTDEISNGLTNVASRLHIARLACEGLASDDGGGKLIASMIFEIEQELKQISGKLCTPSSEGELDYIRRQVEFGIADLIKERQEAKGEETRDDLAPGRSSPPSNGSY